MYTTNLNSTLYIKPTLNIAKPNKAMKPQFGLFGGKDSLSKFEAWELVKGAFYGYIFLFGLNTCQSLIPNMPNLPTVEQKFRAGSSSGADVFVRKNNIASDSIGNNYFLEGWGEHLSRGFRGLAGGLQTDKADLYEGQTEVDAATRQVLMEHIEELVGKQNLENYINTKIRPDIRESLEEKGFVLDPGKKAIPQGNATDL